MSGVAGIFYFDGRPVHVEQIQGMTQAMRHRGADGIHHWCRGSVGLGHCMVHVTPESLREIQPLTNEDETLVLVMDGRVDNREDLRRELLGKGAILRHDTDAELVLRAYEVWADGCANHIVGECVFFIWDGRRRRLFAARDAAGTRHFYYHQNRGGFAFASEIKGLLTLGQVPRVLNDARLLDFFVDEFDREDQVATVYEDISRLPAGHCLSVDSTSVRTWRYWDAGSVVGAHYSSMGECAEAFREKLHQVVQCRLRGVKPHGAMLSGGLDSSSIVGMISKDFRSELTQPLKTFSMVQGDRENCHDWRSVQTILAADPWLSPTVISSDQVDEAWALFKQGVEQADDPFDALQGWAYELVHRSAAEHGCGTLFDGLAGDTLFYSPFATLHALMAKRRYGQTFVTLKGLSQLGWPTSTLLKNLGAYQLGGVLPGQLMGWLRTRQDRKSLSGGAFEFIQPDVAWSQLSRWRSQARVQGESMRGASELQRHASRFHTGLVSYAHELRSNSLAKYGLESRSPFSDRRMIEFAVGLPFEAKLASPWYKALLRQAAQSYLPESVTWRKQVGFHPGWTFYSRLADNLAKEQPGSLLGVSARARLPRWLDMDVVNEAWTMYKNNGRYRYAQTLLRTFVAGTWLTCKNM